MRRQLNLILYALSALMLAIGAATPAFAGCTISSKTMTITPSTSLYPNAGGLPAITLTYNVTFNIAQSNGPSTCGTGVPCTINPVFTVQPTAPGGTYSSPNCTFTFNIPNPSSNITRSGSCSMTWTAPAGPAASYTLDASLNTGLAALQIPAATVKDITVYRTPSISVSAATPGAEAGPTAATFTLTASNPVDVPTTVNLTYSGTATSGVDYTAVTTATIAANTTTGTVNVPVLDDFVVDPAETIIATVIAGSGYVVGASSSNTATITDNDTKGIVVSGGPLTVAEPSGTATFTVHLNSQPTGNVTVALASSDTTESTPSPASLTFTAANWNVDQTVTVTAVDDLVADGSQPSTISLTASGADYAGVTGAPVAVTTTDNDTKGITVTGGPLTVAEPSGAATFTVHLNSQPTGNVTVALASSDTTESTPSPASLSFDAANWNVDQTVTVTAVDDLVADGSQPSTISITASGADYAGVTGTPVSVTTTDNDAAGLTVSPNAVTVSEAGSTANVTAVLNSQPIGDVTVAITGNDATEASLSTTTLTFTPANWNTPQTVTVTGVDDALDDGDQSFPLTLTPSGADYAAVAPQSVAVTVTDDDAAGLVVAGGPITVSETGTTSTFTVVLTAQPVSSVVVTLAASDTGEAVVAPATLTFTPANWNVAQTATVTGVDDTAVDGDIASVITVTVNPGASDPGFSAVPTQTVAVTTQDDDTSTNAAIASAFQAQTYNFMAHRANMITTHEPELFRLINRRDGAAGSGNNGFNVDVESGNAKGDFALSASALQRILSGANVTATPTADVPRSTGSLDAWIEGQFAYYKDKTDALADHGNFLIGYAGVDYKAADNLLLGVMAEVDWMAEHQDNGKVKGTGWMVGPYLTSEPADDVFFDLRAMWGKSNNSAVQNLLGADMGGDFDTNRWLVEAKLAGIYHAGDFDLTPDIRLIYMRENQDDFMVSGGGRNVAVNGQTVSLGQLSTGVKLSRSFVSETTTIEPYVSGHLTWNFENPELRDVTGGTVNTSDLRGEAALGLTIASDTTQLSAEASYDGLFSHDLSAVSAKLMFAHQF